MDGGDLLGKVISTMAIDERMYPIHTELAHPITVDRREKVYLSPISPNLIDSNQNINFLLVGNNQSGIDLSSSYFTLQARLTKQTTYFADINVAGNVFPIMDTTQLTTTLVGPHALFSDIRIKLNGTLISDAFNGNYPHLALIKNLLFEKTSTSGRSASWLSDWETFVLQDSDLPDNNYAGGLMGNPFGAPTDIVSNGTVLNNITNTYHYKKRWVCLEALAGSNAAALVQYINSAITLGFKPKDGIFQ